jgi:hypothetical protein
MLDYTTMGTCVLVLTLATLFLIIPLIVRAQRSGGKTVSVWFLSGLTGILLGAGGAAALVQLTGYELSAKAVGPVYQEEGSETETDEGMASSSGDADGSGSSAGGRGGGMRGMGPGGGMMGMGPGGGMMGMGPGRGPSPKRELTMLVRKIDLLTGDIALNLTEDQAASLATILVDLRSQPTMTDDQATAARDAILAVLDEAQKARQEAIGLPFGRGGGRGGRGGGPGEGEAEEDANPFAQEENATAMQSLLARLGSPTPVTDPQPADRTEASAEDSTDKAEATEENETSDETEATDEAEAADDAG